MVGIVALGFLAAAGDSPTRRHQPFSSPMALYLVGFALGGVAAIVLGFLVYRLWTRMVAAASRARCIVVGAGIGFLSTWTTIAGGAVLLDRINGLVSDPFPLASCTVEDVTYTTMKRPKLEYVEVKARCLTRNGEIVEGTYTVMGGSYVPPPTFEYPIARGLLGV